MAKHRTRNTIDELIELKMLERFESMFKPGEQKKPEEKKGPKLWQVYLILVLLYPIIGPAYVAFLKLSVSALATTVN